MEWLHRARLRWSAFIKRRRLDRDLEEEIRFHLEMKADRNRESGMDPREAAYAAQRQFGNTGVWKERIKDMWSLGLIESFMQDVRYAARSLGKTPGFAASAILVLALGIGSTTAIFSMVNAVLLRGLPFQHSERLVLLWGNVQRQKVERRGNSYPDYLDWKAKSTSFDSMAAYSDGWLTLTGVDEPERISGEYVSAGYFELLGIEPSIGRTIRPDEDRPGNAAPVIVISEGLWKRRFASDPTVIGKQLLINQRVCNVIGVVPAWFRGLTDNAEIWAPFTISNSAAGLAERGSRGFPAVAKLKSGVSVRQAQAEMDGISKQLEQAYPNTNSKRAVEVAPIAQEAVGELRTPLLLLLGAVGFVLLIACANVANLLLARSEARRQEIAVRVALGAGRARVLRQLVTESLLLSLCGAALGLALSVWAVQLLTKASPITLPSYVHPQPDWTLALFSVCVSVLAGVIVGIMPAIQATGQNVYDALKESSTRSGDGVARHRFRDGLVVFEVTLAMTLLIGAGLLMRSFQHLSSLDPGFDPNHMLTLIAALPRAQDDAATPGSAPDTRTMITGRRLLERIKALPSVVSASIGSDIPLTNLGNAMFYTAEGQPVADAQSMPRAYVHRMSPDYLATLRATFVAGRTFTEAEVDGARPVIIVSDNLTRRFWPGLDPIGKRVKSGGPNSNSPWLTIVGVVREMKYRGLPANPTADPDIFFPFSDRQRNVAILIRSAIDPSSLGRAVRATVRELDPAIPVYEVATMSDRFARAIERSRFASWMMGVFAVLALTLASIGLYGVMSYSVRRRTRELGVRIAIGASPKEVAGMVVRRGMILAAIGLALGVTASFALTRLLDTMLFGVNSADPLTFALVGLLLATVALIASYLPARRASHIDPLAALRHE